MKAVILAGVIANCGNLPNQHAVDRKETSGEPVAVRTRTIRELTPPGSPVDDSAKSP